MQQHSSRKANRDAPPSVCSAVCDAVQRMVMRHVKPHTLLVGHSLDNDLAALKVGTSHYELCTVHCELHTGSSALFTVNHTQSVQDIGL
jgi:hypothetical protein